MLRSLAVMLLVITSFTQTQAQVVNSDFQKLFDLYILDDNEDCYYQSLKRMDKDKYRRSPEVYLYAMRSGVKLLDNRHFIEENPRLLKDVLKYGAKYVKYKEKTDNPEDFDLLYAHDIELLRITGLEEAEYYYHESKFRKAAYYAKKVYKLAPEDPRNQLLLGLAQLTRRNTREGQENLKEGIKSLAQEPSDKDEDLIEKEKELIYYLARASSIELIGMRQHEVVKAMLEEVSPILTEKQNLKLEEEFESELAQG